MENSKNFAKRQRQAEITQGKLKRSFVLETNITNVETACYKSKNAPF